jgi:MFS superfamily sulfate permease-like transporter
MSFNARADLITAVSVAGLLIPEAVAYAGIAGLPPARAIVAVIAGELAYAALGSILFT